MLNTILYVSGESYRIDTVIEYNTNPLNRYCLYIDFEIFDYNHQFHTDSLSLIKCYPDQIAIQCLSQEGKPIGTIRTLPNITRTQGIPPIIVTSGLESMNEFQRLKYWLKG